MNKNLQCIRDSTIGLIPDDVRETDPLLSLTLLAIDCRYVDQRDQRCLT